VPIDKLQGFYTTEKTKRQIMHALCGAV